MLDADEFGVDQANIATSRRSLPSGVRRLLGLESDFGEKLGLTKDWVARTIRLVGNSGDVYDLDTLSKLGIARCLSSLWDRGAVQYAPPIR